MITHHGTEEHQPTRRLAKPTGFDMEVLVGYILLVGVLLSVFLILIGVVWNWIATGQPNLHYSIQGLNYFHFSVSTFSQLLQGEIEPNQIVNLGIVTLLFTPYLRVFASMIYFAVARRNLKYTLFTAFVFAVLTYSLLLR